MCLCLNSELADIQNLLSFAFLIHRGYLPVVSCSEHNLLINFQFIDPKGNLSLLCTGYCYNKMLHKGASKIKAFYVHFNQYHFYLIYSPVLNFWLQARLKNDTVNSIDAKKLPPWLLPVDKQSGKSQNFFKSGKSIYLGREFKFFFFFSGKGQGILKPDV